MADFVFRHRQFLAFCAVGATGVAVNMAVFEAVLAATGNSTGVALPQSPPPSGLVVNGAAVAGWLVSVASNFLLNDLLTFSHRAAEYGSSRRRRMARYYASAASALALQLLVLNAILWLVVQVMVEAPPPNPVAVLLLVHGLRLANLAGIGAGTVVNYVLSRNWVFK